MAQPYVCLLSPLLYSSVPCDDPSQGDLHVNFKYPLSNGKKGNDDKKILGSDKETLADVNYMMQSRLRSLYHSAHLSGKDQFQIRLECTPVHAEVASLFCFPFLSRGQVKRDPSLKERYLRFLHLVTESPWDALPLVHEMQADYARNQRMDNTVLCQVMVACDEIFWVKDLATGVIVQGHEEGGVRRVWHLVRMEMVVEAQPTGRRFPPVRLIPGNWQLTDIDDLLGGNLIL
jgi:hypothetical protein